MSNVKCQQSGFGLLEVVLSAGILATVIGASVSLMNSSLRRATLATERTAAMNLAQEGVELVRAARDTTYIDRLSNDWNEHFDVISTSEGTRVDTGDSYALVYQRASGSLCCHWALSKTANSSVIADVDIDNGIETITLGTSQFQREVYVTLPSIDYATTAGLLAGITDDDVIRRVKVIVRWGEAETQAVESIVYITNWRQGV